MKKLFAFLFSVIASITLAYAQSSSNESGTNEADETVYTVVEKMPEYPGGQQALFDYLKANVKYPEIARANGIQGRSLVQFVVNKDGSISDVQILRSGGDPSLDKEAVRVISSMPNWIPGKQGGKLIRVRYTVPVNFRLTGDNKN
jgi:protein TonB